jgi:hypothetical protein
MLRIVTFEHDFVMPGVNGLAGIAPGHVGRGHDGHSVDPVLRRAKAMPDRVSLTGFARDDSATARFSCGDPRGGRPGRNGARDGVARVARREVSCDTLAGMLDQTPRHCVCLKPSSSAAAELHRHVFRTDPHDMCPRWFSSGWICRPEREQRTQSVDANEIDAAQVDDQYAAIPHQPSGVRAHVVYVGRVDLAADGDHGEFAISADPNTGSATIDDCRAVLM